MVVESIDGRLSTLMQVEDDIVVLWRCVGSHVENAEYLKIKVITTRMKGKNNTKACSSVVRTPLSPALLKRIGRHEFGRVIPACRLLNSSTVEPVLARERIPKGEGSPMRVV